MHDARKAQRGISIIEVLVAMATASVVIGTAFQLYLDSARTYHRETQIAEMRQNARNALEFMGRDALMAGAGLRTARATVPVVLANEPSDPTNYSSTAITILSNSLDIDTMLSDPMPQPSAELKVNSISGFVEGQRALVWDGSGSWDWMLITQVQSSSHLQHNTTTLSKSYAPPDTTVAVIDQVVYRWVAATMTLERNANDQGYAVVSENIEFVQIRYWDQTGTELFPATDADRRAIRRIGFTVRARTAQRDRLTGAFRTYTLRSDVAPRNLPMLPTT